MKNKNFYIKHFDDYHEIESDTHKTIELGCFPSKRVDRGYCRYFGLFYTGRKPSFNAVWSCMKNLVHIGSYIVYGEHIGLSEEQLRNEIKYALKKIF